MREKLVNSLIASLIAAVIACGWCGYEIGKTAKALTVTVQDADSAVKESQQRIKDTSQNLNAALLQIGLMTDEARRASIEQRQYWNKVSAETVGAVKDVRAAVGDARELIQASTKTINQTSADLHDSIKLTNNNLIVLESTLKSLDSAVRDTDRNFSNNQDLIRMLKGAAGAMDQLNKTAGHIEAISGDFRKSIHGSLNPTKGQTARGMIWTGIKLGIAAHPW